MEVFEKLNEIAKAVDAAEDAGDLVKLQELHLSLKSLPIDSLAPTLRARAHYYCANALVAIRHLQPEEGPWWNQPFFEEEMIERRLALKALKECASEPTLECQVLTNLGNAFNNAGRFTEALDYWNRAISIEPRFGMALANRGLCYFSFARHVQTEPEQTYLLRDSHGLLPVSKTPC